MNLVYVGLNCPMICCGTKYKFVSLYDILCKRSISKQLLAYDWSVRIMTKAFHAVEIIRTKIFRIGSCPAAVNINVLGLFIKIRKYTKLESLFENLV